MNKSEIPVEIRSSFEAGSVIPALPLALRRDRSFDERRERALLRYYIDAGAGGIAVGVHSTQFEIRDSEFGLFEPVLELASEAIDEWSGRAGAAVMKIAGCTGSTSQAAAEARLASDLGYHACLAGLAGLKDATIDGLIDHCREIAEVMPVIGFYLQPAVGGRLLPFDFWRRFAQIENVIGIKIAPFNRYQTFDVVRGVGESGRDAEITLYTGNDDNIVADLLTEYRIGKPEARRSLRIKGGLLGHWGFWTKTAVALLDEIHRILSSNDGIPGELFTRAAQITDVNAAVFDPEHQFRG
ncbi:MAG: dihydrodipicolinate synthase family protein, partial [Spirochaetales bacterium]|nr:dihydrodipicolinate synthase family protein [Spirochaetales bacterium]